MSEYEEMYNRLYAAAVTGILAARTKEAKEYSIVALGKDAQDYANAAMLHWSTQIYQKQRLEKKQYSRSRAHCGTRSRDRAPEAVLRGPYRQ